MDIERFQAIEKQLAEQAEANRITNENLANLLRMMSARESKNIVPIPPTPTPAPQPITTIPKALQPSWIKPCAPNDFDGDRSKGRAFLTSCEIYTSLTTSDFPDYQTQIQWALSYCKTRRAANFAECIIRQEMRTGKMVFTSWTEFTDEFESIFCPENEATTALMTLESDQYFQGKRNVDAYTNEFRKLVALSGYTDPIAIILKFCRGLQPSTQEKLRSLAQIDQRTMIFRAGFRPHVNLISIDSPTRHSATHRDAQPQRPPPPTQPDPPSPSSDTMLQRQRSRPQCPLLHVHPQCRK
jgi:hypothetical protein